MGGSRAGSTRRTVDIRTWADELWEEHVESCWRIDGASNPARRGLLETDASGERLFTMNTIGATTIHCWIHPQMRGTLVVWETLNLN